MNLCQFNSLLKCVNFYAFKCEQIVSAIKFVERNFAPSLFSEKCHYSIVKQLEVAHVTFKCVPHICVKVLFEVIMEIENPLKLQVLKFSQ